MDGVRRLALKLEGADEVDTWGHPTFRVNDKIFASLPEEGVVRVKSSEHTQAALIQRDPTVFAKSARLGDHGWIDIQVGGISTADLRELLTEAWASVAPGAH